MEALSVALAPYKDIIGSAAVYITVAQFSSLGLICNAIRKNNSTKGIPSFPLVGAFTVCLCMLKYALILEDEKMMQLNRIMLGLSSTFCLYYYVKASNKWQEFLKPLSVGMALVATLWGYSAWERPELVKSRYGFIVTSLVLLLFASPLRKVKEIIATKDASSIPLVTTSVGLVARFFWLLYAVIIRNNFVLGMNLTGFSIFAVQLILILIYRGSPAIKKNEKKKK